MSMYKLGVVGDKDTILAFKALGLSTFPVVEADEAKRVLKKLAGEDYAVIFVTEQIAQNVEETIKEINVNTLPAIILIPNSQGTLGIGMKNIKASVEKAIGVDILSESEGEKVETR